MVFRDVYRDRENHREFRRFYGRGNGYAASPDPYNPSGRAGLYKSIRGQGGGVYMTTGNFGTQPINPQGDKTTTERLLNGILNILNQILQLLTPTARMPQIINQPVAGAGAANETKCPLPLKVRAMMIKARNADIQIAFQAGDSGTYYILLPQGASIFQDNINTYIDGIFFQSASANAVLEVLTWRA
ncbi:MAG: hypothetical protein EO766_16660 [Hydrotalea sp. AMD]|uniref:hypothetical protein n=1 Tax=Hydrotalea sp. AMD TaxID=2501297 RepID=UPI001025F253|nr:hypothetical protein [Hydrotalea sp. AMD]RWZ85543.1 MAG: hypothetical protein EO766_16660 [Hydrotalea sp. AMD]